MKQSKTGKSKAQVLVVDDHPVVREGLARVINQEPDLMVCGEAATAEQAVAAVAKTAPAIAVIDLSLAGGSSLELLTELKRRWPRLPVLVLSMHDELLYAERCLRAGARGYIMKQEPPAKLLGAIRQILRGEIYVSETLTSRLLHNLADRRQPAGASPMERLSNRELQVFELLGQGQRPRMIAAALHLSVKTVGYHTENIKRKLNLRSAAELVRQAICWAQAEPRS